jgi:hypothetical protein
VVLASDPQQLALTIQMPVTLSYRRSSHLPVLAASLLICFLTFGKRRRSLLLCSLILIAGCGGGFRGGSTAAGTAAPFHYNAVVTATTTGVLGDTLTHSATFGLVVTQ